MILPTAEPDTATTALNWKVALHKLALKNVSVDLQMPLDSMRLAARLGDAEVDDAVADRRTDVWSEEI